MTIVVFWLYATKSPQLSGLFTDKLEEQ